MRTVVLTLVLLLSSASSAAAAPVLTLRVTPTGGATLGQSHRIAGTLTDGGAPVAGQVVTLQARPAGAAAFAPIGTVTTGEGGRYAFDRRFDRSQRLRVSAAGALAGGAAAVFPVVRLSARTLRRNVIRITQSFPAEAGVPVLARTAFYLGRAGSETARFVKRATVRRRGTRYLAQATVRVPVAYRRRFAYAACLQARPGSALGDPDVRCPRRTFRFP